MERNNLEMARFIQNQALCLTEIPAGYPVRADAEQLGYRYLKISVIDVTTGNPILMRLVYEGVATNEVNALFTFRRLEEIDKLLDGLYKLVAWPNELLNQIYPSALIGDKQVISGTYNAEQIAKRRLLGGRKRGKMREKTKERYRAILYRRRSGLWFTDKDFFDDTGCSPSLLRRARTAERNGRL